MQEKFRKEMLLGCMPGSSVQEGDVVQQMDEGKVTTQHC